jgi:transposase
MEYLCYLANASLTLRLVEYLLKLPQLRVSFVSVINTVDGWVVRIRLKHLLSPTEDGNLRAILSELRISYLPPKRVQLALWSLAGGVSPVDVMRRYHVTVVSSGNWATVHKPWLDAGYDGDRFARAVWLMIQARVEVIHRIGSEFEILPKRWVVERTFGWFNQYSRLSKDYQRLTPNE